MDLIQTGVMSLLLSPQSVDDMSLCDWSGCMDVVMFCETMQMFVAIMYNVAYISVNVVRQAAVITNTSNRELSGTNICVSKPVRPL